MILGSFEAAEQAAPSPAARAAGRITVHRCTQSDEEPKFCSMLPAFVFEARPVITVEEAVRGELEVIAWRDGLKRK
jgi:hypothetical protein